MSSSSPVWCRAMHGMHEQEQSQEEVDEHGVLQSLKLVIEVGKSELAAHCTLHAIAHPD